MADADVKEEHADVHTLPTDAAPATPAAVSEAAGLTLSDCFSEESDDVSSCRSLLSDALGSDLGTDDDVVLPPDSAGSEVETAQQAWRALPHILVPDRFGYGRSPAFWYTLNFAYNHAYDLHRFHEATAAAADRQSPSAVPPFGCNSAAA